MRPHHFAKIAIRILALFLVYRALEFGIYQLIASEVSIGAMAQGSTDPRISGIIKSMRIMTGIGALVPLLLAAALWFAAPVLSRWVAGTDESPPSGADGLPLRATILQAAGIIMIAMAATTLPKMVYEYRNELRKNPEVTLTTSRVYPDAIQFIAKLSVGTLMLLAVKKSLLTRPGPSAKPADSCGDSSSV